MDERTALAKLTQFCRACGTQREAAKRLGIGEQYLSDILKARRPLSDRVLASIGLQRVIVHEKKTA